jgi:hypothetical protein
MTYARKLAGLLVLLIAVLAAQAAPFAYIANSNIPAGTRAYGG